jgi:hypothetical protein
MERFQLETILFSAALGIVAFMLQRLVIRVAETARMVSDLKSDITEIRTGLQFIREDLVELRPLKEEVARLDERVSRLKKNSFNGAHNN